MDNVIQQMIVELDEAAIAANRRKDLKKRDRLREIRNDLQDFRDKHGEI